MGYIKEPDGINFVVENKGLSDAERLLMNQIIAVYKAKKAHKASVDSLKKATLKPKKKQLAV